MGARRCGMHRAQLDRSQIPHVDLGPDPDDMGCGRAPADALPPPARNLRTSASTSLSVVVQRVYNN